MKKRAYPNIQWRDGVAQLRVTLGGKRHRESLHTSNLNEAIERRDKRIAELKEGAISESATWHTPGGAPKRYATVREFADEDITRQREQSLSSEHTLRGGLMLQWKRITRTFETVDQLTDDSVAAYFMNHRRGGLAHQSIKRDIPLLRRCSEWGCKHYPDLRPVTWKAPTPSTKVRYAKGVNSGVARMDLDMLRKWLSLLGPDARAQAALVLHTGIRAFEVRRLTHDLLIPPFLDLPTHVTKGGIPRRVALTPTVARGVATWIKDGTLLPNYRRQFNRAGKEVYGDTVTLRDLRHTFASLASRHDPDATRLAMGHKTGDRNASMFYQHASDERLLRIAEGVASELGEVL